MAAADTLAEAEPVDAQAVIEDSLQGPTTIRLRLRGVRDYVTNVWVEILLNCFGFVSGVLVARWLGPAGRGQLAAAMLWPGVIGILITFGLQHAFVYAVGVGWAKPERLHRLGLKFTIVVAIPVMVVYWLASPWILAKQFPNQSWVPGIFALYIPLSVYAGFLFPLYQGTGDFKRWNIARLFRSGAWTLGVFVLALVAMLTVARLLVVQIIILAILCVYLYLNLRHLPSLYREGGSAPLSRIVRYGLAIYVSGLAYSINQQLDQLLLSVWVTPSDLGQYAAAATLAGIILMIPSAIGPTAFSKIARLTDKPLEQWRQVKLAVGWSLGLTVPAAFGLILLASQVSKILYGSAYLQTPRLLQILAAASISLGMAVMLADVLRGLGRPMYASYGAVAGAVITVPGLIWTLARYGIWGAAWVSFAAYSTMMLIQVFFLWSCLRQNTRTKQIPWQ